MEDGYSWVELCSDEISHALHDELGQAIANALGADFYLNTIRKGEVTGAIDWCLETRKRFSDNPDCDIEDSTQKVCFPKPTAL